MRTEKQVEYLRQKDVEQILRFINPMEEPDKMTVEDIARRIGMSKDYRVRVELITLSTRASLSTDPQRRLTTARGIVRLFRRIGFKLALPSCRLPLVQKKTANTWGEVYYFATDLKRITRDGVYYDYVAVTKSTDGRLYIYRTCTKLGMAFPQNNSDYVNCKMSKVPKKILKYFYENV